VNGNGKDKVGQSLANGKLGVCTTLNTNKEQLHTRNLLKRIQGASDALISRPPAHCQKYCLVGGSGHWKDFDSLAG